MCINSTKRKFTVDRSGKCFIITNKLDIKKRHLALFLIFNLCQYVDHLVNIGRLLHFTEVNKIKISLTCFRQYGGITSDGQFCNNHFQSIQKKKEKIDSVWPKGEAIADPLTYLKNFPLQRTQDSFVGRGKNSLNPIFDKPSTFSVFSKRILVQIIIVLSSWMFIKREPKSRLPIKNLEICSSIFSGKANEFFIVYSLPVKDFKIGT